MNPTNEHQLVMDAFRRTQEKRTAMDIVVLGLNACRLRGELTMDERDSAIKAALDIVPQDMSAVDAQTALNSLRSTLDACIALARLRTQV